MPHPAPNRPLNPRRIGVIMMHTFTQLVRMKVFYFLGVFALILLASNLFNIQGIDRPNLEGVDVLAAPALAIPAPPIGAATVPVKGGEEVVRSAMLRNTQLFNLSRHPAISLPCGTTRDGWPVG